MKNRYLKILSLLLALIIVAAMATFMTSCGKDTEVPADTQAAPATEAPATEEGVDDAAQEKTVTVDVIDDKGETTTFTLSTKADNLEDALLEANLVEGTESEYGLYITTVNGVTADYDADGSWWALQKDGEMLMTGAHDTLIADGDHYELVYTK